LLRALGLWDVPRGDGRDHRADTPRFSEYKRVKGVTRKRKEKHREDGVHVIY
jgi:hypothetical protein